MKRFNFISLVWGCFVFLLLVSCQRQSLQQYMVNKSESPNFSHFTINPNDFVATMLMPQGEDSFLKNIDKINVLSYSPQDELAFEEELLEVKQIIKNENLNELVRFHEKAISTQVLYMGTDENIREIIFFFVEKGKKIAVTRVITHGISVDEVSRLINALPLESLKGKR